MGVKIASAMLATANQVLGSPSTTTYTAANQLVWLNEAYLFVSATHDHNELDASETIATVASTATTAMTSTDVLRLKDLVHADTGQVLEEIDRAAFGLLGGDLTTNTGRPERYYVSGMTSGKLTIRWCPIPDDAYSVIVPYRKRPTALLTSTATVLNEAWDMVVEAYFISKFAAILRNYSDAKEWFSLATSWAEVAAGVSVRTSAMRHDVGPSHPWRNP